MTQCWYCLNDPEYSAGCEACTERKTLTDEIDRLRTLLTDYGRHNEGCSAAFGDTYRCRCGWRDVTQIPVSEPRERPQSDANTPGGTTVPQNPNEAV